MMQNLETIIGKDTKFKSYFIHYGTVCMMCIEGGTCVKTE